VIDFSRRKSNEPITATLPLAEGVESGRSTVPAPGDRGLAWNGERGRFLLSAKSHAILHSYVAVVR